MTVMIKLPLTALISASLLFGCERGGELEQPEPAPTELACEDADALTKVWTPARRAELDAALEQLPGEWPEQLLGILDARVASQASVWRRSYLRACEQQDHRSQRCLDTQAWELDAIVSLAIEHPERAHDMWAEVDAVLRDADACDASQEPSFDAPALSPEVGRAWSKLRFLLNATDYAAVSAVIDELEGDATVMQSPAYALAVTASEALVALSIKDAEQAESALRETEAHAANLGARAQIIVAQAQALTAFARNDLEAGVLALERSVAAGRAQPDPWLSFLQLRNIGRVKLQLGDVAGAVAPLAEAISLSTRLAGAENPHTAEVQLTLAEAQSRLDGVDPTDPADHIAAAHDLLTQARDSFVNTLGPDHPQTLASVEAIGQLFMVAGRPGDAQYAYLDLLEIYGELYGPKDWRTASVKLALGDTLMVMEQHEGARTMYMEALVPLVQGLGADHRAVIRASIHLGIAEFALGNLEEALVHCRRGVDLVKALGPDDPLVAEAKACVDQLAAASSPKRKRSR
jgi:tetratricopeptide (TPR) repeat protein